jgi:hypothetical protein
MISFFKILTKNFDFAILIVRKLKIENGEENVVACRNG